MHLRKLVSVGGVKIALDCATGGLVLFIVGTYIHTYATLPIYLFSFLPSFCFPRLRLRLC